MATIKRKKQKTKIELPKLKMPGFGTFLFALVFIYILIRVVAYVNDSDPIIFTVEQSTYDTDFTATGLGDGNTMLLYKRWREGIQGCKYICH